MYSSAVSRFKISIVLKIVIFLIAFQFSFALCSQNVQNTTWKTFIGTTEALVEFTQDSFNLIIGAEKLELSSYFQMADTLFVKDRPNTVCGDSLTAIYLMTFDFDSLVLNVVRDSCDSRRNFLDERVLKSCISSTQQLDKEFQIYPNPSFNGKYQIRSEFSDFKYSIFDVQGKIIISNESLKSIDLSHFNGKRFIVRIRMGEYTFTQWLIKP